MGIESDTSLRPYRFVGHAVRVPSESRPETAEMPFSVNNYHALGALCEAQASELRLSTSPGREHVMYQDDIHDAATAAQSATQAIDAASRRRAAAVSAAQNMIDNATAAERAEQDAARAALAASIRRLLSQNVNVSEIARICQMSVGMVQASAVPS